MSPEAGPGDLLRTVRGRVEPGEHHGDRGDLDPGFGCDGGVFEVSFAEAPVGGQPCE